ncbi:unnamed protein product [Rodentolepis nana]|uniref:CNNM transmembrane domain-containing protein n=1 Tax=Rodentolepis nana TaxID=102285 RepID=A0A0R3TDL5_RODNA|nr:unnamed protein product [Rodentolepis nana]
MQKTILILWIFAVLFQFTVLLILVFLAHIGVGATFYQMREGLIPLIDEAESSKKSEAHAIMELIQNRFTVLLILVFLAHIGVGATFYQMREGLIPLFLEEIRSPIDEAESSKKSEALAIMERIQNRTKRPNYFNRVRKVIVREVDKYALVIIFDQAYIMQVFKQLNNGNLMCPTVFTSHSNLSYLLGFHFWHQGSSQVRSGWSRPCPSLMKYKAHYSKRYTLPYAVR